MTKTDPERNRSTGRIQGEPKASGEKSDGFEKAAGVVRGRGVGGGVRGGAEETYTGGTDGVVDTVDCGLGSDVVLFEKASIRTTTTGPTRTDPTSGS